MGDIKTIFRKTALLFFIMMVLCGLLYTGVITAVSQVFFKHQADGSIIEIDGVKYGSELLGQRYAAPSHLWGRVVLPDVSTYKDDEGNPLMYAGASNKSPAGGEYEETVKERIAMVRAANPDAAGNIPVELITCSGSGLDPHISPAAAEYQVPRLAKENSMTEEEVRAVIKKYTKGRFLGILGEETVDVLKVNLTLEGILTES